MSKSSMCKNSRLFWIFEFWPCLIGVSVKSLAQNLILEFTPASTNQSSSSESYILEIERQKDSWTIVQHSLPPFIPVAQLREDSDSDLKVLVASISDYLYAYYQRREALHLVKVTKHSLIFRHFISHCRQWTIFASSLNPDQARQNDLDLNWLSDHTSERILQTC